ncbi:heterochromatin protein 1-like [Bradysia coprophila]|uniref:heterochromatin protein 1-like n=1 Tax=Bradysia coprophila TaxID=38358 RepID=UPI00187D93C7|nr:heterochromatin protein 1-like [Bradysia coprophila]
MGSRKRKAAVEVTNNVLGPEQYEVEKVLKKRTRKGKTEYLIKWLGYPSSSNSWEPSENLDAALLASIEEEAEKSDEYRYKFEEGFSVLKILAAKMENDEMMFLFQYRNTNEGEFVPAKIANVKFPQLVIEYYEGITLWTD